MHPPARSRVPHTLRAKRPCNRRRVTVFSMSLRTSAHTGAAIRVPAEKLCKLAILRANLWRFSDSPEVLLSVMSYRREYGLPRRFAPRNDMQKFVAHTRCKDVLPRLCIHPAAPPCTRAHVLPSACHCEPVRTLVWQSASPQRYLTSWQLLGRIRTSCGFALGTTLCHVLPQGYGLPRRSAPRNDNGGDVLAPAATPPPSACHRKPRTCTRAHLPASCLPPQTTYLHPRTRPSFCMSLRTSAHTGVAIRVPWLRRSTLHHCPAARIPTKLVIANQCAHWCGNPRPRRKS